MKVELIQWGKDKHGDLFEENAESCSIPYAGAPFVRSGTPCGCGSQDVGCKSHVRNGHLLRGDGHCIQCNAFRGELRVTIVSLFGEAEDEAVLSGRPRVY